MFIVENLESKFKQFRLLTALNAKEEIRFSENIQLLHSIRLALIISFLMIGLMYLITEEMTEIYHRASQRENTVDHQNDPGAHVVKHIY